VTVLSLHVCDCATCSLGSCGASPSGLALRLPHVHGAWAELYDTFAGCNYSATSPTERSLDGLLDGVCCPHAGPHGNAMKLACAGSRSSLVEFDADDSCDGAALATYTGTQGECVDSAYDPVPVRFSCSTVAPMASQYFAGQHFVDSACAEPEKPTERSQRGLKRYIPASGGVFTSSGCSDSANASLTGGADNKAT